MSVFLDTSTVIKLYFAEADSPLLRARLRSGTGSLMGATYLSALTPVEFASAAEKKVRTGAISPAVATATVRLFQQDATSYRFITLSESVLQLAAQLVAQHSSAALRALDAIQLACALQVRTEVNLFLTADVRLEAIFAREGLPVR